MSEIGQRSARGLRNIVIAGGGTVGWMAAAALARVLTSPPYEITLVESEGIGTVGVGEGTLPSLPAFHALLGVDEKEFLNATNATFKLGIEFRDWEGVGKVFLHPFGAYGVDIKHTVFQAYWLKRRQEGRPSPLEQWSVTGLAARLGRFGRPPPDKASPLRSLSYAYHLDEMLYARFLRAYAQERGVHRIEGEIAGVTLHGARRVESLRLRDGRAVSGDFFIDCSGFEALVIAGELQAGYSDWSHWFPCDRAVAVQCESAGDPAPFTQATARESGWQWRIPLRQRAGHGCVYSSAHVSDDEATSKLVERLEGKPLFEPLPRRFKAGRRTEAWIGNCLALGPAAGLLEPLEATSIHLVQTGLARLFALFPDRDFDPAISAEYNRQTALEYEHLRDFLILHYAGSQRDDSPFWRQCRAVSLPEMLTHKRDLFTKTGRVAELELETFQPTSWLAIYTGLGMWPERYEPVVDLFGSPDTLAASFEAMPEKIRKAVETLPAHATYLKEIAKHA